MSTEEKAHLAAFAFPFGSHPTALFHLVQRLAAACPQVHFSYFNIESSNKKVLSRLDTTHSNIKIYHVDDGVPEGHVSSGNPMEFIEFFIKATPANFSKRLEQVEKEMGTKATCLLSDAFLWFSGDMAQERGIPWLAYWAAGPSSISLHLYIHGIRAKLGNDDGQIQNLDQTLDFIPGMSAIRASDLPVEILQINGLFSHMLYNMSDTINRAYVVLNSFDGVDSVVECDLKSKLKRLLNIGPFPLPKALKCTEDQSGCLSWLSHQDAASVAYISFGTILTPPQPELVALAEALEEKQVPYLWSFADNSKRILIQGFFERTGRIGKLVEWAPQTEVLSHPSVGVFVTHCGWNSTLESILGGVPMICMPFFADQMINRRLMENVWRIGVGVQGDFSKSGMVEALDLVLWKDEGNKMRENIGRLKERAYMAVAEKGSSTEDFKSLTTKAKDIASQHHEHLAYPRAHSSLDCSDRVRHPLTAWMILPHPDSEDASGSHHQR
ncbi:anthocyanidin 3-O-glucosyltransferase 7-like [Dorcoceras hygrometricum]|uniref:Glycosyltransferase n=1 Tax=Dorcoceras hygrometricum TaxID=472368 RepID=A0A2Z7AYK7_9LAMI|nr:anthocyanidin 3-O-glucosyltransferase 7-like [Dorcoceras hygrometricum]